MQHATFSWRRSQDHKAVVRRRVRMASWSAPLKEVARALDDAKWLVVEAWHYGFDWFIIAHSAPP